MLDTDREMTVVPAEETASPVSSAPFVKVGPDRENTVWLAPELTVPMATAIAVMLSDTPNTVVDVEAALISVTLRPQPTGAIVGWDFVEDGEPVPVTGANVARLIPWDEGGMEVADKANDLYMERYFRPFRRAVRMRSSPPMPTDHLTSATNGSGPKRAKVSKRSSRSATAGKRSGG